MKKKFWVILILVFVFLTILLGGFLYLNHTSYFSVDEYAVVDGKLAFKAMKFTGQEVIIYDGNEYGAEYDKVYHIKDIGGKLTFSAYKREGKSTTYYIVYGDEIISDTGQYYDVENPVEVNGTIAFEAHFGGKKGRGNGKSRIVYNGQVYGEEYNWASDIADIGGKLAYVGQKKNHDRYIVYDGVEIGLGEEPTSINGTLAYISGNKVIYGGEVIGEYDLIQSRIYEVNGKPAFVTFTNNKSFIVYDGNEYGKEYNIEEYGSETIFTIYENNQKLGYSFVNTYMEGNKMHISDRRYVYDGQEVEHFPMEFNVKQDIENENEFIILGDERISPAYRDIAFIVDIDGNLTYTARKFFGYSIHTFSNII